MDEDSTRLTVTVEQAAKMLGIGRSSAYEAAKSGQLPTIRIGRRLVVPRAGLEKLLRGE
jgi:excisionase family DNA binding protein